MSGAAVVIVNFRTAELATRCALAAARERRVGQVVVVDSASGDGSAEMLRGAGVDVIERDRNAGFAAAVNAGFRATSAAFVIVLNADTQPREGALDRLVEHLDRHPQVGVAAPRLVFGDGRPQPSGYRHFPGAGTLFVELCAPVGHALAYLPRLDRYRAPDGARKIAHATGAALAIRRTAFDDAGPLDEGYFLYLEETEWQRRVRDRGWAIERVPEAEVVHHVRAGAEGADTPSPHFVRSAQRYLSERGLSPRIARIALGAAILGSRVGLRMIAAAPATRAVSLRRAAAYDELWNVLRGSRTRRAAIAAGAPLHVGLNLMYWVPDAGGSGTYARELIAALHTAEPGTRITAWVGRGAPAGLQACDWGGRTRFVRVPLASSGSPLHVGYELAAIGLDARRRGCDVVHGLAYASPLVAPGVATLVTILDLTWRHDPASVSRLARTMFGLLTATCGRSADRVIAISQSAADDLVATLGLPRGKIDVTPLGVSAPSAVATAEPELRERLGLPAGAPFLLCVAQIAAHKNLRALIDVLPADAWLVVCGRHTPHSDELRAHARARGVGRRLVLPGFVSDADLEGLYAASRGFVLASRHEGFGLPILEAMARGLPVACSDASALPEVAGGAALLFEPRDAPALRAALERLLGDDALRARLSVAGRERAAQLTWSATARATLAAYRRALGVP